MDLQVWKGIPVLPLPAAAVGRRSHEFEVVKDDSSVKLPELLLRYGCSECPQRMWFMGREVLVLSVSLGLQCSCAISVLASEDSVGHRSTENSSSSSRFGVA